jgi:hypothetical protein
MHKRAAIGSALLILYGFYKERIQSPGVVAYEREQINGSQRISIYRSGKEFSMSPIIIVIVLILTFLFIILSIVPLLMGPVDIESTKHAPRAKAKGAH